MKVKSIEIGKRYKKEAVFLIITANIYSNVEDNPKYMMMQMRTDGGLGFPGGMVDEGETLTEAVIREVYEELGDDNLIHPNSEPFCSHLIKRNGEKMATHLYHINVSSDKMKDIVSNSITGEDFLLENRGNVIMSLNRDDKKYNKKLMDGYLATSVREELEIVIPYFG